MRTDVRAGGLTAPKEPRPSREKERPRPERVCPNCGAALLERKCKLLCPEPACGYYMSCSDFV
jgi:hypothetical protein